MKGQLRACAENRCLNTAVEVWCLLGFVLLAFCYVFTNLVKYRYAEGHVFAAAAPKGGVFSEPIQGNSSRRNRLVKAKSPKGGVFSEPVQGNSLRQNTPLQGEIDFAPGAL